ncbi:MAG: Kef-type transport system, putative NAD-binding component [Myxococcales bacterium]|nr:Kef-type transport system, putative NAD-binding component [Myxococcales bacterium]
MAIFKQRRLYEQDVEVVGARAHPARDLYHLLLRLPWWADLAVLSTLFLAVNLLFATTYYVVGGIHGAKSFIDDFFFSVETMGTIGYGEMYPTTRAAHAVMTVEALTQIFLIAVTTGLVFAKFSIPRARVQFAERPVISPYDGAPMLQFRIGNERASALLEAVIRVVILRTEKTKEGVTIYRMHDLKLERDRSPALSRSWTVLHRLETGPLAGATPESLERDEVEILLTLSGTDELSAQILHAQRRYLAKDIAWGARHADLLTELPDGRLRMDLAHFHEIVPTRRTDDFPYGEA